MKAHSAAKKLKPRLYNLLRAQAKLIQSLKLTAKVCGVAHKILVTLIYTLKLKNESRSPAREK